MPITPSPNEWARQHGYKDFPPRWNRWLSALREAIIRAQPMAGRHVSVDVYPGEGTVINVDDTSARRGGGGGGGPPPTGACCVAGSCSIKTAAQCSDAGGHYLGDGTTCTGVDCTQGACCHADGTCTVGTHTACTAAAGSYLGDGSLCDPNPCGTHGACCHTNGSCTIEFPHYCEAIGGVYLGADTLCTPDHCCAGPCLNPYTHNCAGYGGFITPTNCYCTQTETEHTTCSVFHPEDGTTYSREFTSTNVTTYGWHIVAGNCVNSIISSSCSCTLTRHFRDGTSDTCDCCGDCPAGFCADQGGVDCSCSPTIVSDSEKSCTSSFTSTDGNITCSTEIHITLDFT